LPASPLDPVFVLIVGQPLSTPDRLY
jgi:hypothetical protein